MVQHYIQTEEDIVKVKFKFNKGRKYMYFGLIIFRKDSELKTFVQNQSYPNYVSFLNIYPFSDYQVGKDFRPSS